MNLFIRVRYCFINLRVIMFSFPTIFIKYTPLDNEETSIILEIGMFILTVFPIISIIKIS